MSPNDVQTVGSLLNLVGLGLVFAANVGASRHRAQHQHQHVGGMWPQRFQGFTARGRIFMTIAVACIGGGVVCLVYGIVAG